jgi:hypothetical protein
VYEKYNADKLKLKLPGTMKNHKKKTPPKKTQAPNKHGCKVEIFNFSVFITQEYFM